MRTFQSQMLQTPSAASNHHVRCMSCLLRGGSKATCQMRSSDSLKKVWRLTLLPARTALGLDLLLGLASTSQAAEVPPDLYVPGPVEVGPEIWAGVIASCIPFAIGSWEFAKRIIIQQRCEACQGSGLVMRGRYARKCPECGGFFPWQGWRNFFLSTAAPGNGGPLRAPRGQKSVFYQVPPAAPNGSEKVGGSRNSGELPESDVNNNGTKEAVSGSNGRR